MKRLGLHQLGELDLRLSDSDREILRTLRELRYLKTNQLQRIFFPDALRTPRAALTATSRTLNRLKSLGLIYHLEKRVGGARAGSLGLIWYITEAGTRLLDLGIEGEKKRNRQLEPSPVFLRHTLAVSECCVQIRETCRAEETMRLKSIAVEPECWRTFEKGSRPVSLRPDLYAETISGEYEDHWFIEMDLDTEAVPAVLEKCRRYHSYYQTGKEQLTWGVFPLVLWIVPAQERKEKLTKAIQESFKDQDARIFLIIVPDELKKTLKEGAEEDTLI